MCVACVQSVLSLEDKDIIYKIIPKWSYKQVFEASGSYSSPQGKVKENSKTQYN